MVANTTNRNSKQQYDDLLEMQDYEAESDNYEENNLVAVGGGPSTHQMQQQYQH